MIMDITIGQYFPGESVIHRLDSRAKLVLNLVYLVLLFVAKSFASLGLCVAFILGCYLLSHIKLKLIWKSIRPIIPLILITTVINVFFLSGEGDPLINWGFLKIYKEGLYTAGFNLIRVLTLITGMSLLTYTTSPIALTDAIERLMSPLKKIRFPVHEMSMMMTIALRFIPTLIEETNKIMMAQKSRGADMESGGLIKRVKAFIPILIPLFVSAFKRANELALAMECRCYRGGEGRTRLKQLKFHFRDLLAVLVFAALAAGIILLNQYLKV